MAIIKHFRKQLREGARALRDLEGAHRAEATLMKMRAKSPSFKKARREEARQFRANIKQNFMNKFR